MLREIIFGYWKNSYVEIAAKERPGSLYLPRAVHIGGCDSNVPTLRRLPRALPRKHCCLLLPQCPKKKKKEYRVYSNIVSASPQMQLLQRGTAVYSAFPHTEGQI